MADNGTDIVVMLGDLAAAWIANGLPALAALAQALLNALNSTENS